MVWIGGIMEYGVGVLSTMGILVPQLSQFYHSPLVLVPRERVGVGVSGNQSQCRTQLLLTTKIVTH